MFKRLFLLVIVLLSFASADKPMFAYDPHPIKGLERYSTYWKKQYALKYAHSPSTVYYDHKFHQFYCSTGDATDNFFNPKGKLGLERSFDHIRYRTSKDGSNWSAPRIVLTVNERSGTELDGGKYDDLCACDPAVVYGDDGYWYMLYGSNNKKNGYQYDSLMSMKDPYPLVIYLARARFVQGPYFKYTDKGWEDEIYDDELKTSKPKIVLGAETTDWPEGGVNYRFLGAAQPTIVRKDNKFYVWYRTNWYREEKNPELCISLDKMCYVYHNMRFLRVVVDKLTDLPQIEENFDFGSNVHIITGNKLLRLDGNGGEIPMEEPADGSKNQFYDGYSIFDVRYNVDEDSLEMWTVFRYLIRGQKIKRFKSGDGINWRFVKDEDLGSYNYIHNAGVAGDAFGAVKNGKYLISFSAPYSVVGNPEVAIDWSDAALRMKGYNIEDHRDREKTLTGSWGMWQQLADKGWKKDSINYPSSGFELDSKISATKTHYFTGDFDGDGVSDLGAVDKSSHKWYLYSSRRGCYMDWGGNCRSKGFGEILIKNTYRANGGIVGDGMTDDFEIIAGDYDGDGKTDVGAVDRTNSRWYIRSSRTGGYGIDASPSLPNYIPWGWQWGGMNSAFKIVVGDYNGDGIADRAIYNGSDWFIISSLATDNTVANGFYTVRGGSDNFIPWGWSWGSTHIPLNGNAVVMPGDFDGDGITDRAVYETNSGKWTSLSTRIGGDTTALTWRWLSGNPIVELKRLNFIGSNYEETMPIVGDYDGDGVDDLVHVEKSTGNWVYFSSLDGKSVTIECDWGVYWMRAALNDRVVILVGDFDGDGKMDPAFVDRGVRKFYVRSSRTEMNGINNQIIKYVSFDPNNGFFRKMGADPIDDKKPVVPEAPSMNVAVEGRKVTVTNVEYGSKVAVFDMLGKRVLEAPAGMNAAIFEVPSYGKYIVRSGAQSRVIMVK